MEIKAFHFNPFIENTYVLYDETREAVLIDCGCLTYDEQMELKQFVDAQQLSIKHLLNTHLHIDHSFGNAWAAKTWNILPEAHKADEFMIKQVQMQAQLFGIYEHIEPQPLGNYLDETDTIHFGNNTLQILHVPGHSAGSICFYSQKDKVLMVGDVLFRGSIGRTDLPGGNYYQLIENIQSKLMKLPDDTVIYSGHGLCTSIGQERTSNPFITSNI